MANKKEWYDKPLWPGLLRLVGATLVIGSLGVLAASFWPNQNDPGAGALLGLAGAIPGVIVGIWWANRWLYND